MKRIVPALLLVAALSGCASMHTASSGASQETDYAFVAAINRAAQSAGVQVIWINAPRKFVQASGS